MRTPGPRLATAFPGAAPRTIGRRLAVLFFLPGALWTFYDWGLGVKKAFDPGTT